MTTRELLREVAHDLERLIDHGQAPRGWEIASQQAAALRAIADRFDEEMGCTRPGCISCAVAARLDATVTPEVKL